MSSYQDASNPQDLGRSVVKASMSPQDEYYRYKLLEAKLGNVEGAGEILKARSEQDEVEIKILAKLVKIRESTPEWNQVVDLTGSKNRFEQARILAEIAYEKEKAEQILSFYVPSKSELGGIFRDTNDKAVTVRQRTGALGGVATQASAGDLAEALGVQQARA
jgi:hypothetical protein